MKIQSNNCTSLQVQDKRIQTIEHLFAALYVLGIDSLVIDLNGDEIPILDGSASPFVKALLSTGIRSLRERKKFIKILRPFSIGDKESSVSVEPAEDFIVSYFIFFNHPAVREQEFSLTVNQESFVKEIAPARTFGFLKDVTLLKEKGLALGGSLENAVVLDDSGVINGPLRFNDEFVRHKVMDLIGDLSLLGSPLKGHFKARKAGHNLHLKTLHFILDSPDYWETIL
jgi:UDP-3-O-[3-hydroxymyristoyl] N-acetylglucosamine deacetylase